MTGKGDTYRPVDWDKWSEGYDRIFSGDDDYCPACGEKLEESESAPCLCQSCGCRVCEGAV